MVIHIDHDTFCAEVARMAGHDVDYPIMRLCELDDRTVLTPTVAVEQALMGTIQRLVYGPDGHVLDYGRKQRLFTGALRDAIRYRDRECTHPGCELPARKCQVDHIQPWEHHGHTKEANGRLLCGYHHRQRRRTKR